MTLDKVTSLADLAFKAKTNKYYRQLAALASAYFRGNSLYRIQGRVIKDEVYAEAMEFLVRQYKSDGYEDCSTVVQRLNELRCEVVKEPEPLPEVKPEVIDASALKKNMGEKIIAELKKKNIKAKAKTSKRGVRSSTVSRSTVTRTRAGATRTRRAPTRRRAPSTRR